MRLPHVQIAMEILEAKGPVLVEILPGIDLAWAVGSVTLLVSIALSNVPDDTPPSLAPPMTGAVLETLERRCCWRGEGREAGLWLKAMVAVGILDVRDGAARMRGLGRYDEAFVQKQEAAVRPAWRAFIKGKGPDPRKTAAPDENPRVDHADSTVHPRVQTQTQTQTHELPESSARDGEVERSRRINALGHGFCSFAAERRHERFPEMLPDHVGERKLLPAYLTLVRALLADGRADSPETADQLARAGFVLFLDDPHWVQKGCPFAAFAKEPARWVTPPKASAAAPSRAGGNKHVRAEDMDHGPAARAERF